MNWEARVLLLSLGFVLIYLAADALLGAWLKERRERREWLERRRDAA